MRHRTREDFWREEVIPRVIAHGAVVGRYFTRWARRHLRGPMLDWYMVTQRTAHATARAINRKWAEDAKRRFTHALCHRG